MGYLNGVWIDAPQIPPIVEQPANGNVQVPVDFILRTTDGTLYDNISGVIQTVAANDAIQDGTTWNLIGSGGDGSGGLLPTTYRFVFNGASALSFLDFWDRGQVEITTGTGEAVPASPNAAVLASGNTITIGDSATGIVQIWRYRGTNYEFGSDTQIGTPNDLVLVYEFSSAESIARAAEDKTLEQAIHSITGDTILSQSGLHLDGTGPITAGGELFKVPIRDDDESLEAINSAYLSPDGDIAIRLLPDETPTISEGIWTIRRGGSTIAQLPDVNGFGTMGDANYIAPHSIIAGYQSIANPTSETSTLFAGSVRLSRYDGRYFIFRVSLTDGVSDIEGIADAADSQGDRPITGNADLRSVFRNVFRVGAVQSTGFWARNDQGQLVLEDITRATTLGVTEPENIRALSLQAAFEDPNQVADTVTINRLDEPYAINGITVNNGEFYAVPGDMLRFALLSDVGGDGTRSVSSTIYFDVTIDGVVTEATGTEVTYRVVDLSQTIQDETRTNFYDGRIWLVSPISAFQTFMRTKAAISDQIHISYIPELEANQISNFNESVLNIIEHHLDIDWDFSANITPAEGTEIDSLRRTFLLEWNGGIVLPADIDPDPIDAASATTENPQSVLSHGDTVRLTNTATGGNSYTVIWEGPNALYGANIGGLHSADLVLQPDPPTTNDSRLTTPTGATYLRGNATDEDWDNIDGATLYSDIVPSHPVTNVTSNIPVDNTTIVESPATPYEIGYTLGETIQSGHVEFYGQNVQTLTDLAAGGHTLEITLTQQQAFNASRANTGTYTAPNFQLVARLAGESLDRRYTVRHRDDGGIVTNDIYVDGGEVSGNSLVLHRHGDVDIVIPNIGNRTLDVASNVPLLIGGITDITDPALQTYEITYTIPEAVNAISVDFRGIQNDITVSPAFTTNAPGTYTVTIQF